MSLFAHLTYDKYLIEVKLLFFCHLNKLSMIGNLTPYSKNYASNTKQEKIFKIQNGCLHLQNIKISKQKIQYKVAMGNNKSTQKLTFSQNLSSLNYVTIGMRGWRPFMQDTHISMCPFAGNQDMGLFGVFDGHGGPQTSQFAKRHFANCLLNNANFLRKQYQLALKQTFLQIDYLMTTKQGEQQLLKIRIQNARKKNSIYYEGQTLSGSTANVVFITKNDVYCANAGDSRSVAKLKNKVNNNQVQQLSFDHKPLQRRQKQRIYKAGGFVTFEGRVNANLNLSRGLGDLTFKRNKKLAYNQQIIIAVPDIIKIERQNVDFVLMGCDGIWERKSTHQMVKYITKQRQKWRGNLVKVLQNLLDDQIGSNLIDQRGLDNMTAVIIQFK